MKDTGAATQPFNYFSDQYSNLRNIIGESHKLGFSNPYLYSCLYVYAGGGRINNNHTDLYCTKLGLLTENKELTFLGAKLLRFLNNTTTSKPYLWAQEQSNLCKVAKALQPA